MFIIFEYVSSNKSNQTISILNKRLWMCILLLKKLQSADRCNGSKKCGLKLQCPMTCVIQHMLNQTSKSIYLRYDSKLRTKAHAILYVNFSTTITIFCNKIYPGEPRVRPVLARFFYKCNPLPNIIVKNGPHWNVLSKLAWRKEKKVTHGSFRHSTWRSEVPATVHGGMLIPPLPLAGGDRMENLHACNSGRQGRCPTCIACWTL
jgi:hypothetical protein